MCYIYSLILFNLPLSLYIEFCVFVTLCSQCSVRPDRPNGEIDISFVPHICPFFPPSATKVTAEKRLGGR